MTKLYYIDPLAAAYMAREFKVKFQAEWMEGYPDLDSAYGELEITNEGVDCELTVFALEGEVGLMGECKLYIHPDSYGVFEPKPSDIITRERQGGFECTVENYHDHRIHPQFACWEEPMDKDKIIQRDGKPFFTPEREQWTRIK